MGLAISLRAIVAEAKRYGYFDTGHYPNLRLTQQEMLELMSMLKNEGVPFGPPDLAVRPMSELGREGAQGIVNALRRGVPASEGADYYSVGRENLLAQVRDDLSGAADGKSMVRFLDADIGQGKTHVLYLLRELAFAHGFAVSIVTLSQGSCPLYDYMNVYGQIMWGLRTADQRGKPALANIIDRWVEDVRALPKWRVRQIVEGLPPDLRSIMAAYAQVVNMFRPDETLRLGILEHLCGKSLAVRDMRRLEILVKVDQDNALRMLSEVAATIRYIGFKGVCILFDEAEAIHSFSASSQRAQAYANLQQIILQSRGFPHCYFVYATTPSFFEGYGSEWILEQLGQDSIMELPSLGEAEREALGAKVAQIYGIAGGWHPPSNVLEALRRDATCWEGRVGDYVRRAIAIMDEAKSMVSA